MSVLIKGMKMPANCDECPIQYRHWGYEIKLCPMSTCDGSDICEHISYRMQDCPLIEIPTPHGRLIDGDRLRADWKMEDKCEECNQDARKCQYDYDYTKMDICEWLDDVPTVIESEE